ncbi:hypothetical protein Tco_0523754 [Tanacetum coccineum]
MVDAHLGTRICDSIQEVFRSYTAEFEKKAQAERKRYIDLIENSVKDIIKDEVKSQNVVLAKSSSQRKSTYEAAASLTEFELKKILLDKMQKSKSYRAAQEHRDLYDALVKSYKLDKDLFESYGKAYSLKRDREDKDKNEDPPAGSDQGLKRRKTSKDVEPSKGSKSKESKSSSSKGTKSQPKSSGKSAQAEESVFETTDTEMPQNQGSDLDWNSNKTIDFRPPQTWISKIAKVEKPPLTFDELISTPIEFSAYVMNNLKIDNLTQEHLVGPAFNLLKGTCRSRVELEYHFKECYKAVTDRLDWNNPEGQEYPFDLIKPLPLIEDRGRQVVLVNYFINNDLEYLKGGSSSRKYTTSTTKTKAAKYDDIQGIEDMVPSLWIPVKWYDYGYLEEIVVRREDQKLYKFKEGDFPRLNLRDIEDMLLLLVQKKIANLEKDVIFDLNVAFTYRCLLDLMAFLSGRRWSTLDKQRSRIMIKAIDKLQLERRLMGNLEKFIGGREYEEDFKLLKRTICTVS